MRRWCLNKNSLSVVLFDSFFNFLIVFYLCGFPNPFFVHYRSNFCLVNLNFLNYVGACTAIFFMSTRFLLRPYEVTIN